MRKTVFLPLLLCAALSPHVVAQARPGSRASTSTVYKLVAVKAKGTSRYTDKEILAASGLQLGQDASDGDFKEAAKHLGASGLFSDVVYSFSYSGTGAQLELHLTDLDKSKLLPARFENFVWFSDAELLDSLRHHVPLFKELLPVTGRLQSEVSEALQAVLTEKALPGRVDFVLQGTQDEGDLTGVIYRVEGISTRIRNVEFPGASPEQVAFLTNAVHRIAGAEYLRSALATVARYDMLPPFLQRGYLKAAFAPSEARVVVPSPADPDANNDIEVDAILPVTPGPQYLVSSVQWKGTSVVPSEEASRNFHLIPGQPADAIRLVQDVGTLTRLYHSRGYMTADIKTDAQLDDQKSTVRYEMHVTEGELYKMGELEILGLDSASHDRLRDAWTLQEGQPYNADYTKKFVDDAARFLPRGAQYTVKIDEELAAKDKVVDLTIHFKMQ